MSYLRVWLESSMGAHRGLNNDENAAFEEKIFLNI